MKSIDIALMIVGFIVLGWAVTNPRGNIAFRLIAAVFGIILIVVAKVLQDEDRLDREDWQ
jgi:hypothetical protein